MLNSSSSQPHLRKVRQVICSCRYSLDPFFLDYLVIFKPKDKMYELQMIYVETYDHITVHKNA